MSGHQNQSSFLPLGGHDDMDADPSVGRSQQALPPTMRQKVASTKELLPLEKDKKPRNDLQFTEVIPEVLEQDENFQIVSGDYRRQDIPDFKDWQNSRSQANRLFTPLALTCVITGEVPTIHGHLGKRPEQFDGARVEYALIPDSQYPSIQIRMSSGEDPKLVSWPTLVLYPRQVKSVKFLDADDSVKIWESAHTTISEAIFQRKKNHELAQIEVDLDPSAELNTWSGLSQESRMKLAKHAKSDEPLHGKDLVISSILKASRLTLLITVQQRRRTSILGGYLEFTKYFDAVWNLTKRFGPLWWYSSQCPGKSLVHIDFPYHQLKAPRWLATRWYEVKDDNGSHLEAAEWVACNTPAVWPDTETGIAASMIAISRLVLHERYVLEGLSKLGSHNIQGTFSKLLFGKEHYLVDLTLPEEVVKAIANEVGGDDMLDASLQSMRPYRGTKITLRSDNLEWKGTVTDNPFKAGAFFSAVVSGSVLLPTKKIDREEGEIMASDRLDMGDERGSAAEWIMQVKIAFQHDQTTTNRWFASYFELLKPVTRTSGYDVVELAFAAPPVITNTGVAPKKLGSNAVDVTLKYAKEFALNDNQSDIALHAMTNSDGVSLIIGPPGSGKTRIGTMIMTLCSREKVQMLATAPTNEGVWKLAEELRSLLHRNSEGVAGADGRPTLDFVIVQGGHVRDVVRRNVLDDEMDTSDPKADEENALVDDCLDQSLSELLREKKELPSSLQPFSFAAVFDRWTSWLARLSNKDLDHHSSALEYRELVTQKEVTNMDRERTLRRLENMLQNALFSRVKVVLCTNSAAGCRTLVTQTTFKPFLLLCDEAALATPADQLTPLAVFKDQAYRVILMGDPQQGKPLVVQSKNNEFLPLLKQSLFEQLVSTTKTGRGARYASNMAQEQFRMVPEISEFPRKYVYEDQGLKDTPESKVVSAVGRTFRNAIKRTCGGMPGPVVALNVARDLHGDKVWSRNYQGTTSHVNEAEGDLVLDMVMQLLQEPPADGASGQRISGHDIMLTSPYWGQVRYLQTRLQIRAKYADELSDARSSEGYRAIQVKTAKDIQGHEAPIVIVSFCRNNPSDRCAVPFIAERCSLNVMLTRPQQGLVVVGDFREWCLGISSGEMARIKPKMDLFQTFCCYVYEKGLLVNESTFRDYLDGNDQSSPSIYAKYPEGLGRNLLVADPKKLTERQEQRAKQKAARKAGHGGHSEEPLHNPGSAFLVQNFGGDIGPSGTAGHGSGSNQGRGGNRGRGRGRGSDRGDLDHGSSVRGGPGQGGPARGGRGRGGGPNRGGRGHGGSPNRGGGGRGDSN